MKYIRTKNGIIEVNPTLTDEQIDISQGKNTPRADTIEELCDEFVLCENNHYCVVGDIEAKELAATNYGIIYGAIWSEKGLINVAKANDKGELKLL